MPGLRAYLDGFIDDEDGVAANIRHPFAWEESLVFAGIAVPAAPNEVRLVRHAAAYARYDVVLHSGARRHSQRDWLKITAAVEARGCVYRRAGYHNRRGNLVPAGLGSGFTLQHHVGRRSGPADISRGAR